MVSGKYDAAWLNSASTGTRRHIPPATKAATPLTVTLDTGNLLQSAKAEELIALANRQEQARDYGKSRPRSRIG